MVLQPLFQKVVRQKANFLTFTGKELNMKLIFAVRLHIVDKHWDLSSTVTDKVRRWSDLLNFFSYILFIAVNLPSP